jgi:hypothetical protein
MLNPTETEERQYLEGVKAKLRAVLEEIHAHVTNRAALAAFVPGS